MRRVNTLNTVLISTALIGSGFVLACGGNSAKFSGLSSANHSLSPSNPSPAAPSPAPAPAPAPSASEADVEGTPADHPAPVSGMYLTMACGPASMADGVAIPAADLYGCELFNPDASRFAGAVNFSQVQVAFTSISSLSPALAVPTAGSKWHTVFGVPTSLVNSITSFLGTGYVNTTLAFTLTSQATPTAAAALAAPAAGAPAVPPAPAAAPAPAPAAAAGAVAAAAASGTASMLSLTPASPATPPPSSGTTAAPAPAPAPAPCVPPVYKFDYNNMTAGTMDAVTALKSGANGLPPLQVFTSTSFKAGDILKFSMPTTTRISITQVLNGRIGMSTACPNAWHLNFKDATGAIMTTSNLPDLNAFAVGVTVPTGAVSAWLGFYEPVPSQYTDNEGIAPTPTGATNGCEFLFELDRATCGP